MFQTAKKNQNFNTRGTALCVLYGDRVIHHLTAEDVALLQADPNLCEDATIAALCERYTEKELSRGNWNTDEERMGFLWHISACVSAKIWNRR